MRKQKGFSLIELLIVVAIILIIAAIAIPNLMKGKIAANEASAAGAVRTLITAQLLYANVNQKYADAIGDLSASGFIDNKLGGGNKSGYTFSTAPIVDSTTGTSTDFIATSVPQATNTGTRCYCGQVDGVVHVTGDSTTPCTAAPDGSGCSGLPALDTK